MTGVPTAAELLAVVESSPRATAAHDKAGWVGLFAEDGQVEDPVGSRPHVGHVQIAKFYDTFIGPRQITFHRDLDIISGTSVIRDLTLEIDMGSGIAMTIPTILRYDVRADENPWQIKRLRAYWELPAMVTKFLHNGVRAVPALIGLSAGLLRNQHLAGTAGFMSGLRGVGNRGKRLLANARPEYQWDKMIAAGNTVAASVTTPSGRGVVFAEIARGTIRDISYFAESATDPT